MLLFHHVPETFRQETGGAGSWQVGWYPAACVFKARLFVSSSVTATVKHVERADALAKELGIAVTTDDCEAVKGADIVLLTVKPQTVAEVLQEIAPKLTPRRCLCRVAASVPIGFVEQQLPVQWRQL